MKYLTVVKFRCSLIIYLREDSSKTSDIQYFYFSVTELFNCLFSLNICIVLEISEYHCSINKPLHYLVDFIVNLTQFLVNTYIMMEKVYS